jgi:chloramphenicol 3-O-phosphotransferase
MDLYEKITEKEKKGKIVFLNGVSSSGKTTLALALQEKSDDPCFIIAQDIFRKMWGRKYNEDSADNIYNTTMSLMYKTIKLFADEGKNVIVDHLIFSDDFLASYNGEGTLKDVVNILSNYPVLFIHVTCSVEELRRREKARGDRKIGHAESQLEYLSPKDNYDLTIDTQATTTDEAVEMIIKSLKNIDKASAFNHLKRIYNKN